MVSKEQNIKLAAHKQKLLAQPEFKTSAPQT